MSMRLERGFYWYRKGGNGLTIEIGKDGEEKTVFLQGDEATAVIEAMDDADRKGISVLPIIEDYYNGVNHE